MPCRIAWSACAEEATVGAAHASILITPEEPPCAGRIPTPDSPSSPAASGWAWRCSTSPPATSPFPASARPCTPTQPASPGSSTGTRCRSPASCFFGGLFGLSIEFQDIQGHGPAAAGLLFGVVSVFFGATSILAGRLAGRYGTRAPIVGGLAVLVASAVGLAELPASAPLLMQGPLLALTGLGAALVAPSMNAAILASVPASLAGIGGAVLNTSRQVGTALGLAVFASSFHGRPAAGAVRPSLGCAALLYLCALAPASRAPAPASQTICDAIPLAD